MLSLAADPWSPDRGMGYEATADQTPFTTDPDVETSSWSEPRAVPPVREAGRLWFVDGVRRIEMRLIATEGERQAFGLFGTAAVGAVRCEGRASFDRAEIDRCVVLGGGMRADPVTVMLGRTEITYRPSAEPGTDPNAPLDGLQNRMQRAEANLAARLAGSDDALVLADGRLGFLDPTASPIVGIVKRLVRAYLEPPQDALLPRLIPSERTPLFGLAYDGSKLERLAWYTRLAPLRDPFHAHAGLVRCEVSAGVGIDLAVTIADRVTGLLPRFAARPTDPRFPQNLAPVGALEAWLQHRMGHRGLLHRTLTAWLTAQVPPSSGQG